MIYKKFLYLHRRAILEMVIRLCGSSLKNGDIAQLARACDWQSQGQGFDSPYLHPNNKAVMNSFS